MVAIIWAMKNLMVDLTAHAPCVPAHQWATFWTSLKVSQEIKTSSRSLWLRRLHVKSKDSYSYVIRDGDLNDWSRIIFLSARCMYSWLFGLVYFSLHCKTCTVSCCKLLKRKFVTQTNGLNNLCLKRHRNCCLCVIFMYTCLLRATSVYR